MATATVARPAQPPRRRDAPRISLGKRTANNMDGAAGQSNKKRKLDEPYVWTNSYILKKHKGKAPSLTIHLHPTHFKFEGQDGSFAYDSEMKFLLGHVKRGTVPHEMMQELLENNVPFYDGRLIIEVHDHKSSHGEDRIRHDSGHDDGTVKFSMHNYNAHVVPSPLAPFPKKASEAADEPPEKDSHDSSNAEMAAPEKPKEKDGPRIFTTVLHPTDLSKHHEMSILANTPASEARSKKKGSDATSSGAQPPTPQLSVPPTPVNQTSRSGQAQKMCLEPDEQYSFQADMLVATEPPLYLEPVDNPQDAEKVLDLLQHPQHQEKPPSPKTRKRTTAEVAADDAQAEETVRRLLIMDERLKPMGTSTAANESQSGAASSLTFSRFKTIDMVRQKQEEQERVKKEEELRVSAEKKQAEEQNAIQQKAMAQRQREMQMMAQQQPNQQNLLMQQQQRQEQMRARLMAQAQHHAQQGQQQGHGHPQQNAMMQNQQQNFQGNQGSMQQSSPVVRQNTPMNSSPMVNQGGFPMGQTSSQSAGSPPRPTSGAMQHPMARQVSQQQRGSQNNTPQVAQGTPSMNQAMPNRQMSQTPRMPPGSPGAGMQHGTPTPGGMQMQGSHMNNQNQFTPEQLAMIQQQRALTQSQQGNMQAGSPPQNMTPEQIQGIQQNTARHQQQMMQQRNQIMLAQAQGNPQLAAQMRQRQQMMMQRQQLMQAQQQNAQMHGSPGNAGSPGQMAQQTPQMGHAHPQQHGNMQDQNHMTPQQQQAQIANAQQKAQQIAQMRQLAMQQQNAQQAQQVRQQLQPLIQQYGGLQNIPQQVISNLNPAAQKVLQQQFAMQQQQGQRQLAAMRAQQAQQQGGGGGGGGGNSEQMPSQPNPGYMQQLRQNQAMLAQAQASMNQQGGGGMNGMQGMSFHNMNGMGGNFGNQQGGGGQGNDLSQQFAAMQNALNRGNQGGGGGGQGQ